MSHDKNFDCCEGQRPIRFSRRYFMKQGGIAMVGLSTMPAFLQLLPLASLDCDSRAEQRETGFGD